MTWRKSREIVERIAVEGDLILLTPTSLGNGDSDGLTDMSLLLDEYEGKALLTGTSIAGAVRNYLREREKGFEKEEDGSSICRNLFGWHKDEDDGVQSCLIIDDSIGNTPKTELRDGVRIDGKTRTAKDQAKFDLELLEAGTTFKLRFELLITQDQEAKKADLISAFVTALQGFENCEIFLGARKRRGYGECRVKNWKAKRFIPSDKSGLMAWLKNDFSNPVEHPKIAEAFEKIYKGEHLSLTSFDQRIYFEMRACFALDSSMLIRSGSKVPNVNEKGQPDAVHLRSNRNGNSKPIVSGTSLAGVLRHRAVKICNTLKDSSGERFVERIFGVDMEELKKRNAENKNKNRPLEETFASRLEVKETEIDESKTNSLVHTRVKIDRFTGGAFEGALFDAAPVFARSNEKAIEISLKLRKPNDAEIGLLLLLLKDLWTSDLPVGGESSIGRGRLKGISAVLRKSKNGTDEWRIEIDQSLNVVESDRSKLNGYVKTLNGELK